MVDDVTRVRQTFTLKSLHSIAHRLPSPLLAPALADYVTGANKLVIYSAGTESDITDERTKE